MLLPPDTGGLMAHIHVAVPDGNRANVGEIHLRDKQASSHFVGFKPADSIPADVVWKLPTSDAAGVLTSDGAANLSFAPATAGSAAVIGLTIDGGGAVPSTGAKGFIEVPFGCTITSWTMLADQSGSAQITVSKGTYSAFPTASSIVASAPPNLSSQQKNADSTLMGWTKTIAAGDVLSFNLDSVSTVQRIVLELQVTKS